MGAAIAQPFHDLGVIQATPADALRSAAKAPYAVPTTGDCPALAAELAALDAILGPDVDKAAQKPDAAGELVAGAVRSAFSLPFRGVVRRLTGAEQRDREMREAVRAGTARRGFLKGLAYNAHCSVSVASR